MKVKILSQNFGVYCYQDIPAVETGMAIWLPFDQLDGNGEDYARAEISQIEFDPREPDIITLLIDDRELLNEVNNLQFEHFPPSRGWISC